MVGLGDKRLNANGRTSLSFDISILDFSGQDITSRTPIQYRHLTNNNSTYLKGQLAYPYAIHHCPDDYDFISSRCIRPRGPQAWSLACRDTTLASARTIYYGECDPLHFCIDLPSSLKEGTTALCIDQQAFERLDGMSTGRRDVSANGGTFGGEAVELEVVVTNMDARTAFAVQSIRVWEEAIKGAERAASKRRSRPGGGQCYNCSSLMVVGFSNRLRRVEVKVQLASGGDDAMIYLISRSEVR